MTPLAPMLLAAVLPAAAAEDLVPAVKTGSLREVVGRVVDRRGGPVAGAVVFQSGDAPERTRAETDARGRYRLQGVAAAPTFVFARAEGYPCGQRR